MGSTMKQALHASPLMSDEGESERTGFVTCGWARKGGRKMKAKQQQGCPRFLSSVAWLGLKTEKSV
jgi:hypothetical protein